jgi:tRNA threonylcarbamoyladenosine biosynthesis protein TsaE
MEKYQTLEQLEKIIENNLEKIKQFKIIKLRGDLGAGKTTFVKLYGKKRQIKSIINSPTYNILKTYQKDDYLLVHVDAYRINNEDIGLFDYFQENNVQIFIEWAQNIELFIPQDKYLEVIITMDNNKNNAIEFKEVYV